MNSRFHAMPPRGFTLVETVVGVAVFALVATAMYMSFTRMFDAVRVNRVRIVAAELVSEQIEILRNLPYTSVGVQGGIPSGVIVAVKTVVRDGFSFLVNTTVRNIDDPFDGTIGGSPNDLSPADYKKVEVEVTCPTCRGFSSASFTTSISPKNLETTTNNGALFVQVLDGNGQPVSDASVTVVNASSTPPINLTDSTGANGMLQLVDVPPGVNTYHISVTKPGYTSEITYPIAGVGNPNPLKPHATVVIQQVTQISFSIDMFSSMNVSSVTSNCASIPAVDFNLKGTRLIGLAPDVLKYDQNHASDGFGALILPALEWDSYALTVNEPAYNLAGTVPIAIFALTPNTALNFQMILAPKINKAVMVSVKDAATQLPVSGATVRLTGPGDYDMTLTTGRGFLRQTDWSGGAGQSAIGAVDQYLSDNGNVDSAAPAGEIKLKDTFGAYSATGELTSSTFDTGSASNFYNCSCLPSTRRGWRDQPAQNTNA
jgi:prepilin-type N-terminal cleavage/methylation domain-containing protein